MNSDR